MIDDRMSAAIASYGIWCEVWGGVTGHRGAWLKAGGVRLAVFETLAEAEAEARRLTMRMNNKNEKRSIAPVSFRYSAQCLPVSRTIQNE
jgi:hypothetical protein